MKEQFATYEIALKLKELGFDEDCLGCFYNGEFYIGNSASDTRTYNNCDAPLWQQVIDWLESKYIYVIIDIETIGSDEWEYCWRIKWLPEKNQNDKRRSLAFIEKESYYEYGGSYTGAWRNKYDCLNDAMKEALKLCDS